MLGIAAELVLKAYLLAPTAMQSVPMTLANLKDIGHDLDQLHREAVQRGLRSNPAIAKDIEFLARAHNHYQTRYPLVEIPAIALGKARERRIRDESVKLLKEVQPVKVRSGQSLSR
jgi:hypothetical protein